MVASLEVRFKRYLSLQFSSNVAIEDYHIDINKKLIMKHSKAEVMKACSSTEHIHQKGQKSSILSGLLNCKNSS